MKVIERNEHQSWRKSRIAARLLLKQRQHWSGRDLRLATQLAADAGVTNRLIDQAMKWLKAPRST